MLTGGLGRRLAGVVVVVATAAGGQAAAGGGSPATAAPGVHIVVRGDTLSAVAERLSVSVAALAEANKIADVHRIRPGQRLTVPARVAPTTARDAPVMATSDTAGLPARLREQPDRLALLPVFDAAAQRHKVPADLLKAMTWLESGWQNHKVSSTGAVGIGQLMPATVTFVNEILLRAELDPGRPEDNIEMAARFLAYLLAQTRGSTANALASYYQGLASVRRHGPGRATGRYVADVLALRGKF
ncbi:MAG: transglycosylase SLT domain-containing protein [Acidimicrobiales bacterium]